MDTWSLLEVLVGKVMESLEGRALMEEGSISLGWALGFIFWTHLFFSSASSVWKQHDGSCVLPTIMASIPSELKTKASPFSCKLLLPGYFIMVAGKETNTKVLNLRIWWGQPYVSTHHRHEVVTHSGAGERSASTPYCGSSHDRDDK